MKKMKKKAIGTNVKWKEFGGALNSACPGQKHNESALEISLIKFNCAVLNSQLYYLQHQLPSVRGIPETITGWWQFVSMFSPNKCYKIVAQSSGIEQEYKTLKNNYQW